MQKLFIKNRHDQKIAVEVNEVPNSRGLVFIEHGLGGFKEQPHIQFMAKIFQDASYTTVLFDATNSIGESDGEYEKVTMQSYYEDLEDVISWAKLQTWYQEPFSVAGHSMGAYSAVQFAEDNPTLVNNVVAWAPVVSGELNKSTETAEDIKQWEESGWKIRISNSKPGVELRLPWSHLQERLKHNLLPQANNLTMPIIIMVGEKDVPCPVEHQKMLLAAIPSVNKKLVIIKDAPHTFRDENQLNELKEELYSWLSQFK